MNGIVQKLRKLEAESWLGVCAAVLGALLVVQGISYACVRAMGSAFDEALRAQSAEPSRDESGKLEQYDPIVRKGVFGQKQAPPPPKLFGLLDGSALMGDEPNKARPYELNADLPGGFKLVEIGFNSVDVEREGKRETVNLFPGLTDKVEAAPMPPPGRARGGPRGRMNAPQPPAPPSPAAEAPQVGAVEVQQMDPARQEEVQRMIEQAKRAAEQAVERARQQSSGGRRGQ